MNAPAGAPGTVDHAQAMEAVASIIAAEHRKLVVSAAGGGGDG